MVGDTLLILSLVYNIGKKSVAKFRSYINAVGTVKIVIFYGLTFEIFRERLSLVFVKMNELKFIHSKKIQKSCAFQTFPDKSNELFDGNKKSIYHAGPRDE